MRDKTLNIPMKLMRRCCREKRLWDLLTLAVCMKMLRGDSAMHSPDIKAVRRLMKCSYAKAKRLLQQAKECGELFYWNEHKRHLVARSFTRGQLHKRIHKVRGREYVAYEAYCYKFRYEPSGEVSHRDVSRHLRVRLLLCPIQAKDRKNDFLHVGNCSTRSERSRALGTKRLSAIAGVHHSTVSRHLCRLEKEGKLETRRYPMRPVCRWRDGVWLVPREAVEGRRPFLHKGFLVLRESNEYRLTQPRAEVFCNVIFNHARRHRRNISRKSLALAHFDNAHF